MTRRHPAPPRALLALLTSLALAVGLLAAGPMSPATASVAPTGAVEAVAAPTGIVKTADLSKFRPGMIISDSVFFNSSTMDEGRIDSFLRQKVSRCQSGYTCLKDFRQATSSRGADSYCDAYSGEGSESAARIIAKVARACGINPQVLLVMLEKEQGLVTHTWPSDWRYTIAMGQGCPDTAACDTRYYGFYNQMYGAARQMKIYTENRYFTYYAPGRTWNIRWSPNAACGSSPVYIENQATSNLYYYTPYQPNAAALRAGYGEGDGCSAYGNRNFFQNFTDWFGSTSVQLGAGLTRFWQDSGGANSWIGASTGSMREWPGRGWSQRFANADLYLQNGTTVVQGTVGGTRDEYRSVGEVASGLGWPTSFVAQAGGGWYQNFEGGRIYVRPSDGRGFAVAQPINDAYEKSGNITGPLGWPASRAYRFEGGSRQDFATGSVFQGPTSTVALDAAFTSAFLTGGGPAKLGWPVSAGRTDAGPYVQFGGALMARASGGQQYLVRGETFRGYTAAGGIGGALGAPLENEQSKNGAYSQKFQGGTVYVSTSGTFTVTALSKALANAGGVAALGWPTGPQVGSDSTFSQDFGATTLTTSSAGSFAVGGVIGRSYRTSGGVTSFLGAATGPERAVGDGVVQDFQGGRIYCSAAATTAVPAAVGKALEAAGGVKGRLGWPTGPVLKAEKGQKQVFQGGEIWMSADGRSGAAVVGGILQAALVAGGSDVLGAPTGVEKETPSGWYQEFASGVVFVPRAAAASAVVGSFFDGYRKNGGLDSFGFATGPASALGSGRSIQAFEKATLYATSGGTFVTRGYIRTFHAQQGGAGGVLGVPTKNEYATAGGFRQDFTGGSILVSADGAFVTRGALRAEYLRRGGESGTLGFPLGNERAGDRRWSQRFQGGTLVLLADGTYRLE